MDKSNTSSQPIRVLEIVGNAIVGGMENYVHRLLARLPKEKFRITCLCPVETRFTCELRAMGCDVHIAPIPDEPVWRSIEYGSALIEAEDIEIIHAHLPNAHLLAGILSRMTGVPALATIHGREMIMADFEIHRSAGTHLNVVSRAGYYHALGCGVPRGRLTFIPNGVDTTVFRPDAAPKDLLQRRLGLAPETPLVGFVGRFSPEKGPEVFTRAAALAARQLPDVHFVLLGDGPMRGRLQEIAQLGGARERIHFAGLCEQMETLYPSLSLCVSSSYTEGMPLTLTEAQASGLPVVGTHVGGVPEIVAHNMTGLLVPPGNPDDISNSIVALMRSPERLAAYGVAARARMEKDFPLQRCVDDVAQLIARLARGAGTQQRVASLSSARTPAKRRPLAQAASDTSETA